MEYEFLEQTSDVMFRAYGRGEKELFINAAKAMFSIICEVDLVKPQKKVKINVKGENLEDLLYEWLSSLLTNSEIEEMFFSEYYIEGIIERDSVLQLKGWAKGEDATQKKGGTLVKGVTYYDFKIEKEKGLLTATVTLDI
jgi:SHS2 domain-containing protein